MSSLTRNTINTNDVIKKVKETFCKPCELIRRESLDGVEFIYIVGSTRVYKMLVDYSEDGVIKAFFQNNEFSFWTRNRWLRHELKEDEEFQKCPILSALSKKENEALLRNVKEAKEIEKDKLENIGGKAGKRLREERTKIEELRQKEDLRKEKEERNKKEKEKEKKKSCPL